MDIGGDPIDRIHVALLWFGLPMMHQRLFHFPQPMWMKIKRLEPQWQLRIDPDEDDSHTFEIVGQDNMPPLPSLEHTQDDTRANAEGESLIESCERNRC